MIAVAAVRRICTPALAPIARGRLEVGERRTVDRARRQDSATDILRVHFGGRR